MRRLRPTGWVAVAFAFVIFLTLATAHGGDAALYPARPGDQAPIFVIDNGFHTDLVLPLAAVQAHGGPLAAAAARTSGDPWLLVGWGDARFYEATSPWQDRILDGLSALLGGRPTVVHLQGVPGDPDRLWPTLARPVILSREGLAGLMARADRSFTLGPDGQPVTDAPRPAGEAFFQSREPFSALHLCNHWAAELLDAAGVPTTPVLDTLPAGLALDLKLRAQH